MIAERPRMRRRDLFRIFSPAPEVSRGAAAATGPALAGAGPAPAEFTAGPAATGSALAGAGPAPAESTPGPVATGPAAAPFSLDVFYAQREASGAVTKGILPTFRVTARAEVPASRAGAAELAAPPAASGRGAGRGLPPGAVPRLVPHACIALESFCSVCVERCPAEGALVMERGRPKLAEDRCTGCGRCVEVCPAPVNGFAIVQRALPQGGTRHV